MGLKDKLRMSLRHIYPAIYHLFLNKISIANSEETINYIKKNKCSVCRFGDGEFNLMQGKGNGFQSYNYNLMLRLREVLEQKSSRQVIICIPYTLINQESLMPYARNFWKFYAVRHIAFLYRSLATQNMYFDSMISRFYIDFKDKKHSAYHISKLKELWENRNIVIVEGNMTRSGVRNDLYSKAASIQRIIAPCKNAFDKYSEIINTIKSNVDKQNLILISLGMTATVLAYDLSKLGYQAIDLGHIDIEYEWLQHKAENKSPVEGKYVNEAGDNGTFSPCTDSAYIEQIISQIN